MADFKLGRLKFKWRGDWATSTVYVIDDIVKYGGNSYVCIQNHTSPNNENIFYTSPGTYTNYWQLHGESFYFKGSYANSTWYKLNDVVSYGGKQYRCTTAHTSSSLVNSNYWPKSPSALSNKLNRLMPTLRARGIEIEWSSEGKGNAKRRIIRITTVDQTPTDPSDFGNAISI